MNTTPEPAVTFRSRSKSFVRRHAARAIVPLLLVAFLVVFFFDRVVILVHPGELGVLWRFLGQGTVIDTVYREGVHIILPINQMYVYNVRKQQFSDSIDVLTLDGLTVKVQYTTRYYLDKDTLPLLHQRVGPNYVNVVVRPDVRSVIRTVFGQYKPEEIYTSQRAIQERVSEFSKVRLAARFVSLDDVPIESITLPARISQAIESKMAQQQLDAEYVYRLSIATKEAQRLRIESDGLKVYNDTVNSSLTSSILQWHGIQATQDLAKSPNAKVVVIGAGAKGLPLILGKE
ncbi:MAG TPA: prohibitin family protein [Vicinamibacterales bacterium]|jgi:regulator of protease activity HflC (stomatin/prohibitin superfamily)